MIEEGPARAAHSPKWMGLYGTRCSAEDPALIPLGPVSVKEILFSGKGNDHHLPSCSGREEVSMRKKHLLKRRVGKIGPLGTSPPWFSQLAFFHGLCCEGRPFIIHTYVHLLHFRKL